jgi:AcrR family transcriptional regulator
VEARVLSATADLLDDGAIYAELKVEQIATAAGISRPAFYFYFRDKRELLMRLTEDVVGLLYEEADVWWQVDDNDAGTVEALRTALDRIAALYAQHFVLLRAVVDAAAYDPVISDFWQDVIARFTSATEARIVAEQQAGRLPDLDAANLAFILVWMVERVLYQRLADGQPLDETFTTAMSAIWIGALYSG